MKKVFSAFVKFIIFGVSFCLMFSACDNFLEGGEVRNEIDEMIKYNNAPGYTVILKSDANTGDFFSQKETLKLGYATQIQFELNSDYYVFDKLEAVNKDDKTVSLADYVSFELIEEINGIYKFNVTLLKESNDILIRPVCLALPKLAEFYPPFNPSGYDQDTRLKLTFSKPVDEQTFTNIINFSNITITSASEDLTSYYKTPYFSDDKTILYVPFASGKKIITSSTKDIEFSIDLTGTKDADGVELVYDTPVQTFTYRINSKTDSTDPMLSECHVYSTSDENSWLYRELTNKSYEEWDLSEDGIFYYGDKNKNHVSKVYIQATGSDDNSGIAKLCIKETQILDINGENENIRTDSVEQAYDLAQLTVTNSGNNNKIYSVEHTFTNQWEGLSEIELWFEDYSENESEHKIYYIVNVIEFFYANMQVDSDILPAAYNKDKKIYELNNVIFNDLFEILSWRRASYINKQTGKFEIVFFDKDSDKEICSYETITTKLSYSERKELAKVLTDNPFNVEHTHLMKISMHNESGNYYESSFEIPKVPKIAYVDDNFKIHLMSDSSLCKNHEVKYKYQYKATEEGTLGDLTDLDPEQFSTMDDGYYYIYPYATNNYKDYFYSDSGATQVYMNFMPHSAYIKEKPYIYIKGENSGSSTSPAFPTLTIPENSEITYKKNTEKVKVTIGVGLIENDNTYALRFVSEKDDFISFDKSVELTNGYKYNVSLIAFDSQENFLGESSSSKELDLTQTDTFSPVFTPITCSVSDLYYSSNYLEIPTDIYDIDSVAKTPVYNITTLEYYFIPNGGIPHSSVRDLQNASEERIKESAVRSGIIEKKEPFQKDEKIRIPFDGLPMQNYHIYFIVRDNSKLKNSSSYLIKNSTSYDFAEVYHYITNIIPDINYNSEQDILLYTVPFLTSNYITSPFISLPDSPSSNSKFPTIMIEKINNKNEWERSDVYNSKFNYNYSGEQNWTFPEKTKPNQWGSYDINTEPDAKYDIVDANYSFSEFIKINLNYYGSVYNQGFGYNFQKAFFAKPLIIYPEYYKRLNSDNPLVCESKNTMPGGNGIQIFYDKPFLAHTFYCSEKLTKTSGKEEAIVWMSNAQETGIEVRKTDTSSTYTYANSHYDDIPEGYYYCTLVHFADGDIAMSEIKQK